MSAAPQTIPPPQGDGHHGAGSGSSTDSASPNLSTSPLASLSGLSHALPSPGVGAGAQRSAAARNGSYESSVDALAEGGSDGGGDHEDEDTIDALRRYRQGLYMYTSSRFDRFKRDLEHKQALDGDDQRLPTKRA